MSAHAPPRTIGTSPGRQDDVDPYQVLGVTPEATAPEVRAAYRRAARTTHPDVGGDAAAFDRVAAAYRQLTAPAGPPGPASVTARADGAWRRGFASWPVRTSWQLLLAALTLAGSGSAVGAVVGLWAATVLAPPTLLLWTAATIAVAIRDPSTRPTRTWRSFLRWCRPGRVAAVVLAMPLVAAATVVSGWSLLQTTRAVAAVVRWLSG
jgi:hypothetical protein